MPEIDDEIAIYKISFAWYTLHGFLSMWILAIIVSYFTGGSDLDKFDIKLVSPIIHKWLSEKYHPVELKATNVRINC